jgi:hypothetical protein
MQMETGVVGNSTRYCVMAVTPIPTAFTSLIKVFLFGFDASCVVLV